MKMQKIEVHIKNTEKWIKLIQEDLELINDKEDYLHGHYRHPAGGCSCRNRVATQSFPTVPSEWNDICCFRHQ